MTGLGGSDDLVERSDCPSALRSQQPWIKELINRLVENQETSRQPDQYQHRPDKEPNVEMDLQPEGPEPGPATQNGGQITPRGSV
jgi:hypothetical protein